MSNFYSQFLCLQWNILDINFSNPFSFFLLIHNTLQTTVFPEIQAGLPLQNFGQALMRPTPTLSTSSPSGTLSPACKCGQILPPLASSSASLMAATFSGKWLLFWRSGETVGRTVVWRWNQNEPRSYAWVGWGRWGMWGSPLIARNFVKLFSFSRWILFALWTF